MLRKFVQEGQAVRRGERLMVLSSERYGSDAGPGLRVTLDDQAVTAYGQPRPLQSGMLLDADILQDTRRLWWRSPSSA